LLTEQFCIRDGRRDYVVSLQGGSGTGFDYQRDVVNRPADPVSDNDPTNAGAIVNWMSRSHLDADPPGSESRRLGHYFLPNCASFKVEWALELDVPGAGRELVWIDPADFAGSVQGIYNRINEIQQVATTGSGDEFLDCDLAKALGAQDADPDPYCVSQYGPLAADQVSALRKLLPKRATASLSDPDSYPTRFANFDPDGDGITADTGVVEPVHIFYPKAPQTPGHASYLPDPLFPKALRITIDLYDSAGRLEKPFRHVMVLPVGQG
jgi:hypothetical protein